MNKSELDFSCLDDIYKKLDEMGETGKEAEGGALKKGANIMFSEILARCPHSDVNHIHAKEKLKIGKLQTSKGRKFIKIGIQRDDSSEIYYLKFVEYGTCKQPARPFMRPAMESKQKEVFEIMKNTVMSAIEDVFEK